MGRRNPSRIRKNIIKFLSSEKRRQRRRKVLRIVIPVLAFAFALCACVMIRRRTIIESTRVLVITDEIFYDSAFKYQEKPIRDELREQGYDLQVSKFRISDLANKTRTDINGTFERVFNEKPTRLVLMSPIFTAFYDTISFKSYDYDKVVSKPIMIGMGSILSTSKFDRIYRLEDEIMFRDPKPFEALADKKTLLYYSGNIGSEAMRINTFLESDTHYDMNKGKGQMREQLDEPGVFLLSYRLPDDINLNEIDMGKLVVPYFLGLFFRNHKGYYILHPDFKKMIFDSMNERNSPEFQKIDSLSASYSVSLT